MEPHWDPTPNPPIPDGFREVTEEAFYAAMGPLNVHPSVGRPDMTLWRNPYDSQGPIYGISYPGWRTSGRVPAYALSSTLFPKEPL